jgi:hypothetical protein
MAQDTGSHIRRALYALKALEKGIERCRGLAALSRLRTGGCCMARSLRDVVS